MKLFKFKSRIETDNPLTIVLVGIGGMGSVYLSALLENSASRKFQIAGAVDPFPEKCQNLRDLQDLKIPIYNSLEKFYDRNRAELAIISSPIHFHCHQTCLALSFQSFVLCEKPVAATIQEAYKMVRARNKAERWVAIGYQWSYSRAIQELKKDIRSGLLGKPKRLKCLYLWPRDEAYYLRNNWAGKKCDTKGNWILDSPANNAMAHDLHNMFYILGEKKDTSAKPAEVEAELYRAFDIQNFDTVALRSLTASGVEILFFVSHASSQDIGPVFNYEFEKANILGKGRNSEMKAQFLDGTQKNYGCPDNEPLKKLWDSLDSVESRKTPVCGLEAAMSQTLCLNGTQDSMPDIANFPQPLIQQQGPQGQRKIWVKGLDEVLEQCFETNRLPSEHGISWSKKGKKIKLAEYKQFPAYS